MTKWKLKCKWKAEIFLYKSIETHWYGTINYGPPVANMNNWTQFRRDTILYMYILSQVHIVNQDKNTENKHKTISKALSVPRTTLHSIMKNERGFKPPGLLLKLTIGPNWATGQQSHCQGGDQERIVHFIFASENLVQTWENISL